MQIQLVVTQHQTLVELLLERGVIDKTTPVIEHARPDDVRGMHVLLDRFKIFDDASLSKFLGA